MNMVLDVRNLGVAFPVHGRAEPLRPVDGVSFTLPRGQTLALVGESGCGKSLTTLALLGLVPSPGVVTEGSEVLLSGSELLTASPEEWRTIRGGRIGMVFQDSNSSLNPVLSIGTLLDEVLVAHADLPPGERRVRARQLLESVGLPDPAWTLHAYAHQLSGGMRQRVMIALALAGDPDLLIADEPTTALDVTVQAQILGLLDRLRAERGMSVLLVTHDLGVVAERADRVAVMYAGRIVEQAPTRHLFQHPAHPYTRGLLAALPRLTGPRRRLQGIPGTVPSPGAWPSGCRFHPRCPAALPPCRSTTPPERTHSEPEHVWTCWVEPEAP